MLMTEAAETTPVPRAERLAAMTGITVGLAAAVLYWISRKSLWEDEIIAVTHSLQPFPTFFVETVRNDIHPFLYFMLLKAWAAIAPGSDRWILASSLVSALASAAAVAWVAGRLGGMRAAVWAAALFCVLPTFAWAAGNLRMYALVPAPAILCWYCCRHYLYQGRRRWLFVGCVLELALACLHAIEFFFIFFIAASLLIEAWSDRDREPGRIGLWLATQAAVFLLLLPLAANALLRGTEPLSASSMAGLLLAPAQLFTGWALSDEVWPLVGGSVIFFALTVAAVQCRIGKVLAFGVVLSALFTAVIVGFAGKPMFKPPVFSANLLPFLIVAASLGNSHHQRARWLNPLIALLVISVAVATLPWSRRLLPQENFGPLGKALAQRVRPGDIVVVPRISVFWGVLRYAVGPEWGRPLEVMARSNPQWQAVKTRLGQAWTHRLGLDPATDAIDAAGVRYLHGSALMQPLQAGSRVWVVHRDRYHDVLNFQEPMAAVETRWFGGELALTRLEASHQGQRQFANPSR